MSKKVIKIIYREAGASDAAEQNLTTEFCFQRAAMALLSPSPHSGLADSAAAAQWIDLAAELRYHYADRS